jgi:hypothetical protein
MALSRTTTSRSDKLSQQQATTKSGTPTQKSQIGITWQLLQFNVRTHHWMIQTGNTIPEKGQLGT